MRIAALALVLLAPAFAAAQEPAAERGDAARLGVPRAMREALAGCWALPGGEVHVLSPRGTSGLAHRWRAEGRHGVETYGDAAYYLPARGVVQIGCGARSQHGQHCELEVRDEGAVRVRRIARRHGGAHRVAGVEDARACTDADPRPSEARAPEPHPIDASAPARALLGARRRDVDAGRAPSGEEDGWTRYGDAIAVQYEHGVAMRVRIAVDAPSCEDAARAAGFEPEEGTAPLRRRDGCEWPGRSVRHRLAHGIAARFVAGTFEAWLE